MDHSRLPLRVWFFTVFMMQSKVSVRELAKDLRLPYNTMFSVVRKLRENLYLTASTMKLRGIVELDEVYVTAGFKGKKGFRRRSRIRGLKRRGRGTYAVDKPPILVVERKGLVRLRSLSLHETVNHSMGEYAREEVHTNNVEAEFSVFRAWNATFRGYSKEKLHLYTAHYNFLRNNRHLNRTQRTLTVLIPQAPKS
jgi:transposase-like protein